MSLPFEDNIKLLDEATATIDGTTQTIYADVSNRQRMSVQFICSAHTSGNGVFTIQVSNDGTNWVTYNRLTTNVANTNVQTDERVASVTLNSDTSVIYFFPAGDYFRYMRALVTVTTDGKYSAILADAG